MATLGLLALYHLIFILSLLSIGVPLAQYLWKKPTPGARILTGVALFVLVQSFLVILGTPLYKGMELILVVTAVWWLAKLVFTVKTKTWRLLIPEFTKHTGLQYLASILFFIMALLPQILKGKVGLSGVNSDAEAYCAVTQFLLHSGLPVPHPPTPFHLKWVQLYPLNWGLRMGFNTIHGLVSWMGPWSIPQSLPVTMGLFISLVPWASGINREKEGWIASLLLIPAVFTAAYRNYAALACFFPLFIALILAQEGQEEGKNPCETRIIAKEGLLAGALLACYPIGVLYWLAFKGVKALLIRRPRTLVTSLMALTVLPPSWWFSRGLIQEVAFSGRKVCGQVSGAISMKEITGLVHPLGLLLLALLAFLVVTLSLSSTRDRISSMALISPFLAVTLFFWMVYPYTYAVEKNLTMALVLIPLLAAWMRGKKGILLVLAPLVLLLPFSFTATYQSARGTPLEDLGRMKELAQVLEKVPIRDKVYLLDTSPKENLWIIYFSPCRPLVLSHFTPNFIYRGPFSPERLDEHHFIIPPHAQIADLWKGRFGKHPTFYSPVITSRWILLEKWRTNPRSKRIRIVARIGEKLLIEKPSDLSFLIFPTPYPLYLFAPLVVKAHGNTLKMGDRSYGPLPPGKFLILGEGYKTREWPREKSLILGKGQVFWGWIGGNQHPPLSKNSPFFVAPPLIPHSPLFILQGWYTLDAAYGLVSRWSRPEAYFGIQCPPQRARRVNLTIQLPLVRQKVTLSWDMESITLDKRGITTVSMPLCHGKGKGYQIVKVKCEKGFIPDLIQHNGDRRRLCILPLKVAFP